MNIHHTLVGVGTDEHCSSVLRPTLVGTETDEQCSSVLRYLKF